MIRTLKVVLATLLITLCCTPALLCHDEPPKTAHELTDQEQARTKTSTLGIERQHVWVVTPSDVDQPADSSLWYTDRYDRNGNLVEQTVYNPDGDGRSASYYDNRNTWLEELYYVGDSLDDRTVFVYNRDRLIVRITSYDADGNVTGRLDYTYLADSARIRLTKRIAGDSVQYRLLYSYDPESDFEHQIEAVQTNADGSLRMRTENQYTNNLRSKKLVFGPDNALMHSFSYVYTPDNDFREIVKYDAADSVVFTQNYEYRPDRLLSTVTEYGADGNIRRLLRYTYEFFNDLR